ncbi:MAG: carbohydrate ABC transporter substrate-binding protein [Acidimicrobiales bacterium]|nr:carbohydrate ABC transporter substrate-binding protein [Acidimicrobiales bacterium]
MTAETQQSPSPSEVGFVLGRRNAIKGAAALGGMAAFGGVLAACGSDDPASSGDDGSADGGGEMASGTVRVGSNYSDAIPNAALRAALDVLPNEDLVVELNEVDHNTYQEQIVAYLQDPPDDVAPWFAGFRLQALASQDLLLDISDVWTNQLDDVLSGGFKQASTYDGKQYFVPWTYYSWQVHYRPSVWEELGATPPATFDELLTLCETLDAAGVTPFALGNDGRWPAMGTFDQLNFRLNGYQYHVDLMAGKESWTDDRTKEVFTKWEQLLPYHQPDPNGREWQDAAAALVNGEAAMYVIGGFVGSQFPQDELDDLDFFPYPELNPEHGQDTVEAPIDGWVVVANPDNEAAAKEVVAHFGTALAQDAYLAGDPSVQAPNSNVDTSKYNAMQAKSAAAVQNATNVTQFLDRDTLPAFATEAGQAIADFLANPANIDTILADLQGKAEALL